MNNCRKRKNLNISNSYTKRKCDCKRKCSDYVEQLYDFDSYCEQRLYSSGEASLFFCQFDRSILYDASL